MITPKDIKLKTTNKFILYENEQIIGYDRQENKELNIIKYKLGKETLLFMKIILLKEI